VRAVSRTSHYDDYFRSHLPKEQRRAVLEVLAEELDPGTTMGEVLDAAADIGWGEAFGELNLAELAEVLVAGAPELIAKEQAEEVEVVADENRADDADDVEAEADDVDDLDDDDDDPDDDAGSDDDTDDDADEQPVSVWRTSKKRSARKVAARKAASKKAAKKAASKKAAKKATAKKTAKKATAKKTAKTATAKKTAKKATAKKTAKKVTAKKATAKKATAKKATAKKPTSKKTTSKKTSKKAASKSAKKKTAKKGSKKAAAVEEEALSLEQAAKLLVPMVRRLKEATMQELEERTGMGRRKLRFHIGQLVKNGHLTRHGMGRGTCYTVAKR